MAREEKNSNTDLPLQYIAAILRRDKGKQQQPSGEPLQSRRTNHRCYTCFIRFHSSNYLW